MHGSNFNCTTDSCENIQKNLSMAMNRKIQIWLHAKGSHSHEEGPVEPV
jgi:hypothetical protein